MADMVALLQAAKAAVEHSEAERMAELEKLVKADPSVVLVSTWGRYWAAKAATLEFFPEVMEELARFAIPTSALFHERMEAGDLRQAIICAQQPGAELQILQWLEAAQIEEITRAFVNAITKNKIRS